MGRWGLRDKGQVAQITPASKQVPKINLIDLSVIFTPHIVVWSSVNHTLVKDLSFSLHSQSTVSELYHTKFISWYWSIGKDLDFHSLDTEYVILMGEVRVLWAFHISNLNTQWNMKVWRFCCYWLFLTKKKKKKKTSWEKTNFMWRSLQYVQ